MNPEIIQNRIDYIKLLKDPANAHLQSHHGGLLDGGERCCAIGLWIMERRPELIDQYTTGEINTLVDLYNAFSNDLGTDEPTQTNIMHWNDNEYLTFAEIGELLALEPDFLIP